MTYTEYSIKKVESMMSRKPQIRALRGFSLKVYPSLVRVYKPPIIFDGILHVSLGDRTQDQQSGKARRKHLGYPVDDTLDKCVNN